MVHFGLHDFLSKVAMRMETWLYIGFFGRKIIAFPPSGKPLSIKEIMFPLGEHFLLCSCR